MNNKKTFKNECYKNLKRWLLKEENKKILENKDT